MAPADDMSGWAWKLGSLEPALLLFPAQTSLLDVACVRYCPGHLGHIGKQEIKILLLAGGVHLHPPSSASSSNLSRDLEGIMALPPQAGAWEAEAEWD